MKAFAANVDEVLAEDSASAQVPTVQSSQQLWGQALRAMATARLQLCNLADTVRRQVAPYDDTLSRLIAHEMTRLAAT